MHAMRDVRVCISYSSDQTQLLPGTCYLHGDGLDQ